MIGLYRVVNLAGFAVGFGEIVVIGSEGLGGVGIFVIGGGLFELQRLLVGVHGGIEALLLFRRLGLLGR